MFSLLFLFLLFLPGVTVIALTVVMLNVRRPRKPPRGFAVLPPKDK